jgi:hypothetical protein
LRADCSCWCGESLGGDANEITTDLGLDRLYPRLLAFALIVGMLAICIALSVQVLRQGVATRRALLALSGQALHPVIVGLEGSITIAHKRRRWTYVYEEGGRQERAFIELAKGVDPLFVTPDGKRALALAGPAAACRCCWTRSCRRWTSPRRRGKRSSPHAARRSATRRSGRGAAAVAHSAR